MVFQVSQKSPDRRRCPKAQGNRQRSLSRKGVELLEMDAMPEPIHMLLDVDPQFGIHQAVKGDERQILKRTENEVANPVV